jgi:hypothetical protein
MGFPTMYRVRQRFEQPAVPDLPGAVFAELTRIGLHSRVRPGMAIAVAVGSRGVANLAVVTRAVLDRLKGWGAAPFIVPAMGSHGGATAEGQIKVLGAYGVTEEAMGVPIRSSMEVVELGTMPWGLPLLVDRVAASAEGIVLINRVKPHTNFTGEIESGLLKMLAIGLGKHRGAQLAHRAAVDISFNRMIPEVARLSLSRLSVLCGVGLVENARHETAVVRAIPAEALEAEEKALLKQARALAGRIPFEFLHLLIVDEIGKDVAGTGMDPKVIGRMFLYPEEEPKSPRYMRILVRDLTVRTHGNAVGMGFADFATRRLADKVDFKVTYTNSLTGSSPARSKMPIILDTDREALEVALATVGLTPPEQARVVRIRNTLALETFWASEALLAEVRANRELEILGGPWTFTFDGTGALLD